VWLAHQDQNQELNESSTHEESESTDVAQPGKGFVEDAREEDESMAGLILKEAGKVHQKQRYVAGMVWKGVWEGGDDKK
jgi:hypothetical protein